MRRSWQSLLRLLATLESASPLPGACDVLSGAVAGTTSNPATSREAARGGIRELSAESGLAFKRTQRQTDAGHDGIPRPLFFLRIGEIKAVDDAS